MANQNTDNLKALYKKYNLNPEDVFSHKHFTIITRQGIEKIENKANINITYDVIKCEPTFCVVKAYASTTTGETVETFGSALHSKEGGTTHSWYLMEMAEKRALSRSVLKICGFYKLNHYGADESEDFAKSAPTQTQYDNQIIDRLIQELKDCDLDRGREIWKECEHKENLSPNSKWVAVMDVAFTEFGDALNEAEQ
jgi:hypothetical protein